MVFLYIILSLIGLGALIFLIGRAIGKPLSQIFRIVLTAPVGMVYGAKLAFTKGSALYKWRWLVVVDFVLVILIVVLIFAN